MIGRIVSHFQILERIGAGGMAEVFKAVDRDLDRFVALKFLPSERRQDSKARSQLMLEARAASKLDHRNICTIYEIGETPEDALFIAMAYYEGETLAKRIARGPMTVQQVARIGAQIADGLGAAHRQGVIHHDIKPANIMLVGDDEVKILDFGIARLGSSAEQEGTAFGTIPYVAPERLSGQPGDGRSDLWSLGVVLFRMAAVSSPFQGRNQQEVIQNILQTDPDISGQLPDESAILAPILQRVLHREPDFRYLGAVYLQRDLQALAGQPMEKDTVFTPSTLTDVTDTLDFITGSTPNLRETSVAILPFRDLSPEGDQDYFCQGMTEELIHHLTGIAGLRVISRDSALRSPLVDEPTAEDSRDLGRQLGVEHVLQGSVSKSGDQLRVTARLMRVDDGSQLWSERYQQEVADVFAIQDDITRKIAAALEMELAGLDAEAELEAEDELVNLSFEAHNLYLKGRYFWNKRDDESVHRGIEFFNRALQEEPRYPRAYAGLADSYAMLGIYGMASPSEIMPLAEDAAEQALAMDPRLAEVYVSRALVKAHYRWDFEDAEADFQRALELDPFYATAYQQYAMACLIPLGRFHEAFAQLRRARDLDPLSLPINTSFGLCCYHSRRFAAAEAEYTRALEIDTSFVRIRLFLGQVYLAQGKGAMAVAEIDSAQELAVEGLPLRAALAHAYACLGRREQARQILQELQEAATERYVSPTFIAQIHVGLGEHGLAVHALEDSYRQRSSDLIWLGVHPVFDPLRKEPAFHHLLQRLRLPRRLAL